MARTEIRPLLAPFVTAMPVLRKETDVFPQNLFEIPTADAPWQIVHVRSRQEKVVARVLLHDAKPFYLPQLQQKKSRSNRTFVSHLPLFPGYVFVRRVEGVRETLWRTKAVSRMIEVADQERLAAELQQIRQLQASGAVLTPRIEFTAGDPVRVTEGAFRGYVGIVTEERGSLRLIVSVSVLHRSVTVEFPRDFVEPVKFLPVR